MSLPRGCWLSVVKILLLEFIKLAFTVHASIPFSLSLCPLSFTFRLLSFKLTLLFLLSFNFTLSLFLELFKLSFHLGLLFLLLPLDGCLTLSTALMNGLLHELHIGLAVRTELCATATQVVVILILCDRNDLVTERTWLWLGLALSFVISKFVFWSSKSAV